jgi:flagellar hook-basal body complex protein FliE
MLSVSAAQFRAAYAGDVGAIGGSEGPSKIAGPNAAQASDKSFATHMAEAGAQAYETLKAGESAAIAGIKGEADTQQVVQAVMSAEMTLQTAVAVRDKMVSAYMDIMRMPV